MVNKNDRQILGKGTYGCTVFPNIDCKTNKPRDRQYVTKIQVKDHISTREFEIGQLVKSIPLYTLRYAPIEEQCPLSQSIIQEHYSGCTRIIKEADDETKFLSSKIRYVGRNTFDNFFKQMLTYQTKDPMYKTLHGQQLHKERAHVYLKKLVDSHLYLLQSVQTLADNGILHLDMKSSNMLYDRQNDVFVIIDFGLSQVVKHLEPDYYSKHSTFPFGASVDMYEPWCIEIILLSFIARQIVKSSTSLAVDTDKFRTGKADEHHIQDLKRVCSLFIKKTEMLHVPMITRGDRKTLETQLHAWINTWKNKTWKEIWTALLSTHKSWDNYALSAIMWKELHNGLLDITKDNSAVQPAHKNPVGGIVDATAEAIRVMLGTATEPHPRPHFILEYASVLKSVIMADPTKRDQATQTSVNVTKIFKHLDKSHYVGAIKTFNKKFATPAWQTGMKKRYDQHTLAQVEADEEIIQRARQVLVQ